MFSLFPAGAVPWYQGYSGEDPAPAAGTGSGQRQRAEAHLRPHRDLAQGQGGGE